MENNKILNPLRLVCNNYKCMYRGSLRNFSYLKVLSNKNLTGIYNTIGNVIDTEEKYIKALNTATISNKNFIINLHLITQ